MAAYFIDENGDVWPAGSQYILASLGTDRSDLALTPILLGVMGFIEVRHERKSLQVKFSPERVSATALVGLMYFVHDFDEVPIVILPDGDGGVRELFHSRRDFIARISTVLAAVDQATQRRGARLLSRPLPLSDSERMTPTAAIQAVLSGIPRVEDMATVFDAMFSHRFVITEQSVDTGSIRILSMGRGYRPFDPVWYDRVVGRSMIEYSDKEYGEWVAEAYTQAFDSMTTRYDAVDALVHWPRTPQVRSLYRRLVVPVVRSDGRRIALVATMADRNIDLRR